MVHEVSLPDVAQEMMVSLEESRSHVARLLILDAIEHVVFVKAIILARVSPEYGVDPLQQLGIVLLLGGHLARLLVSAGLAPDLRFLLVPDTEHLVDILGISIAATEVLLNVPEAAATRVSNDGRRVVAISTGHHLLDPLIGGTFLLAEIRSKDLGVGLQIVPGVANPVVELGIAW